ncbi:Tuberous sclerosis 2-like protein [Pleurostoma richardsiae]|uniref:Tuberous sclerosis 2-like protein n=1 Tax=Pleurostoma richardsiae TaxID=41990 RepID=A0AA38RE24_9PEZI|nr:Tuberous sclerosis 2-like protein [Pleurostoma richardsiae]
MLRRLVSIGQQGSESDEPMSPSPGDAPQSPETKSTGGLASVFKGLAGSKLIKSAQTPSHTIPAAAAATAPDQLSSDHIDVSSLAVSGLPPNYVESFEQLKNGTLNERIVAAESLRIAIAGYPLNPVLDIWYAAKDLIEPTKVGTARAAGWALLTQCVKNGSSTDLERNEYFQTLSAPANPEDFHLQLAALVDLTNHGRDLSGFDYDVIPLLTTWLREAYNTVRTARRQKGYKGAKGKVAAAGEDSNFQLLFSFILDVIKFNFKVADDETVGALIDTLLEICMNTSVEEDLRACISVVNAIITFGSIPREKLDRCVEILSSIHCLVANLQKDAWHTLANLCKSHNGQATIQILLNVLRNYPRDGQIDKDGNREARGALSVLQKLIWKSAEKGYPPIPVTVLISGLANVVTKSASARLSAAVLKLINALFDDGGRKLSPLLGDEDWMPIFEVAEKCLARLVVVAGNDNDGLIPGASRATGNRDEGEKVDDKNISKELKRLIARLEEILNERRSDFIQRQDCIVFFTKIADILPDSAATIVLDYFKEFRSCHPSDLEWEDNLKLILGSFYRNRNRATLVRLKALEIITEVFDIVELVEDQFDGQYVPDLVNNILADIAEEKDTLVLQETVSFMVSVASSADADLFEYIVETLKGIITNERLQSPISPPTSHMPDTAASSDGLMYVASQSPSNVVTRGYVQMFLRSMNTDVQKASKTFNLLVHISRSCPSNDARLTAMKMLFRLRADWANRIFLTPFTESEGLAGVLYRTEASLARKLAEEAAQPQRQSRSEQPGSSRSSRGVSFGQGQPQDRAIPTRSASGAKPPARRYQQLWSLPDPDALPEPPSDIASPVLFSHIDEAGEAEQVGQQPLALNITAWAEAILHNLSQGCDWEVYSFTVVHFPSQLSNHALFRDAISQIQELRKVLCEHIRMNCFQEPPAASGLRRPEVAICIFHTLTTIMSYHRHFQKSEEDELVRTFMLGIAHQTAKTCIHALSICCHELPLSTSKSLVTILQKMSSIITVPFVAMHILEFLACLSRLPALYSNFREDEYRIVFGICFKYLDTAREKSRYGRGSHPSEPSTPSVTTAHQLDLLGNPSVVDDLPQYVYSLAYHVIVFWFLALRLPDRANHVGWIARKLFQDVDGGPTSDEQALITLDFMQRVAFADADDSAEDPLFTDKRFGEILKKRWIIGHSLVTIKQATGTGWAQITKRQPSGTSCYTIRENFRPPPPHQTGHSSDNRDSHYLPASSTLPSHLLVQLLSPMPQSYDPSLRPIALPDDEPVERAIRVFDRTSTVDGHKVGVIYIGENQTDEADILANVSGSRDYVEFLNGLGTLTKLKGATFNTQGLDREYDTDGQYTFCWRDRVTEMVFHVVTQMPTNLEHDPICAMKKRHVGNDFVNIIFNDSGLPFKFDLFPSEFNFVNIVITPESRASFVATRENAAAADTEGSQSDSFYKVQVMSKEGFPEISPAAETKMVSLKALPDFIRLLALNASVFSLVWANREGGEHVSSWRSRLRGINRLRERYGPKTSLSTNPSPPPSALGSAMASVQLSQGLDNTKASSGVRDSFSSLRRSSVATFLTTTSEQTSHRSSMMSTGTTDTEILPANGLDTVVESLDFSKWA